MPLEIDFLKFQIKDAGPYIKVTSFVVIGLTTKHTLVELMLDI
jgi:hypothetical protein